MGAGGAGATGTAGGGARRGGSGRRRQPGMGDPAGPSGARARKARAETRAQPLGPGEGPGRRGPASTEPRVRAVLSCPPRVRLGGRAALNAARPEGCLHVPVRGSQKPKSPDLGGATKLGESIRRWKQRWL